MTTPTLLLISGALRRGSTNTRLLHQAAGLYGRAHVTLADLRLPLYDGDLEHEQGIPASVQTLADQIGGADGVIISGPEYNKMISGVLKNALDWISRVRPNPLTDKPVAIMSANAGRTGGETGQYTLRHALVPFRPRLVSGPIVAIAGSPGEFGESDVLENPRYIKGMTDLMAGLRAEIKRETL